MARPSNESAVATAEVARNHHTMTTEPIPRLVRRLALPSLAAMLITAIYNLGDTFFVSHIGTSASAAVGVVMPLMAIIQAANFVFAMGGGSVVSRRLGARMEEEANITLNAALFSALAVSLLIALAGWLFLEPMLRLFGATETALGYAMDYTRLLLFGTPLIGGSFVLNHGLRAQGKNVLSMIGIMTGGLLNLILDPLFIFTFDLGIGGAAIATVLSQGVSFFVLLYLIQKKSLLRIRPAELRRASGLYATIVKIGAPSFFRQAMASVAVMLQNNMTGQYGDAALAAITIVGRLSMLLTSIALGIGQGFQPIAGYNHGARRYDRVLASWRYTLLFMLRIIGGAALLLFFFAPTIISWFRPDDPEVIAIGTLSLRLVALSQLGVSQQVSTNMLMQASGEAGKALFLSLTRQGLFFLPLLFLLPPFWGLLGIQLSQPLADVLATLASIPILLDFRKKLTGQQVYETESEVS